MSQKILTIDERNELLSLIAKEWDKHPAWTFQKLMGEMNYINEELFKRFVTTISP